MEFTIDFVAVRSIIKGELKQAGAEIAERGVLDAYRQSLQRHDARLADAADANLLACKQGCSWCCNFSVDARPVEIFNIEQHIQQHFSAQQLQALRSEITANSKVLAPLDDIERMQHNIKCPFLQQGSCSIYAARPQTCRNYHATSSAGCQQSFEQPDNFDIAPEYAPLVYQTGAAQVDAFSQAVSDAGFDIQAYELNGALLEMLSQPQAVRARFDAGLPAFLGVVGTEVPMEFIDLAE